VVVARPYRPYYPYYSYPRYYGPSFYWGFSGYWGYPWPYYGSPYPYYYGPAYDDRSGIRLQVTPREAEVFVDGYLAGRVDDFDGVFQSLRLPPGDHEVVLYLDGYRTVRQQIYLAAGSTFRIRYTMEPLQAGETIEPRPVPPQAPPRRPASPPGERPGSQSTGPGQVGQESAFGTLSIRVQPANAVILIDGESWQGPDVQDRLLVQVAEGSHRVEIQRDGYETYARDVQVRRGETATLNVSLLRGNR
jgi:hypothetical protein